MHYIYQTNQVVFNYNLTWHFMFQHCQPMRNHDTEQLQEGYEKMNSEKLSGQSYSIQLVHPLYMYIHEYDHCWLNWLSQFDFYSIWKADCFTKKIIFHQGLSISAYRSSTDLDMDQGRNWKTLQQKLQVLCFLSAVFHWAVQQIWGGILIRKLLMRPLSITRQAVV